MKVAALIVAAGRGSRAATGDGIPKQYATLSGSSVLAHTLQAFYQHPGIAQIQVVIHPDDAALYRAASGPFAARLRPPVVGGATRQASVLAGLEALAPERPDAVLIHDAARPFVTAGTIASVIAELETKAGAIAALPVTDTVKQSAPGMNTITGTLPREGLWRAQTPQGFAFDAILAAHRTAQAVGRSDFTDDAAVAEAAGIEVALVRAEGSNMKITNSEDLAVAEERLARRAGRETMGREETRTGQGFDVHRFAEGRSLMLCGVEIAHDRGLDGHSDADVGLHALTDALLGAIGDGDIGQHFPPSDPQWRNAASHIFLADAAHRVRARGARIVSVDVTIVCEAPRVGPHRARMRARVAEILAVDIDRVGVKATTSEGLGFPGRREGIAALALATISLPMD